jgi:hypothetical protein
MRKRICHAEFRQHLECPQGTVELGRLKDLACIIWNQILVVSHRQVHIQIEARARSPSRYTNTRFENGYIGYLYRRRDLLPLEQTQGEIPRATQETNSWKRHETKLVQVIYLCTR